VISWRPGRCAENRLKNRYSDEKNSVLISVHYEETMVRRVARIVGKMAFYPSAACGTVRQKTGQRSNSDKREQRSNLQVDVHRVGLLNYGCDAGCPGLKWSVVQDSA
jgi:hypothetical protein